MQRTISGNYILELTLYTMNGEVNQMVGHNHNDSQIFTLIFLNAKLTQRYRRYQPISSRSIDNGEIGSAPNEQ